MNTLPIPVSNLEFKNNVSIKFNNILDGFNEFKNFTLDGNLVENSELLKSSSAEYLYFFSIS